MSTQNREPEFIKVEDILPIPKKYQVRDPHSPEEIQRLAADINKKGRLTKPIRVLPLNTIFPTVEKYRGKYALVGGTARLIACRVLGAKELRVGLDIYIEKDIHDFEGYSLEIWHDNDLYKPLSWIARLKQAKSWNDEFHWSQDRIAKELGFETQGTVSKYLTIAKALPTEVIDDPFVEKLGPKRALSLSRIWKKNERDGMAYLQRLKDQHGSGAGLSAMPSEKRADEIATEYEKTESLGAALGSETYDRSIPRLAERTDANLKEWAKQAAEQALAPPPFASLAELQKARETIEALGRNSAADPNLVFTLEMITDEMRSFVRQEEDWRAHQRQGTLVEVMKAQFSGRINELSGVVEKLRERQHNPSPMMPGSIHSGPGIEITGIRKTFPEKDRTQTPPS